MPVNGNNDDAKSCAALTTGMHIGHCRIIEKIGAGGMGEVCLAKDTGPNRKVALKFHPFHLCQHVCPSANRRLCERPMELRIIIVLFSWKTCRKGQFPLTFAHKDLIYYQVDGSWQLPHILVSASSCYRTAIIITKA